VIRRVLAVALLVFGLTGAVPAAAAGVTVLQYPGA
jgi:hypothetical protein